MTPALRTATKRFAARAAGVARNARYDRCLLMLSHMRATTTALSNVLCSHPQVAGYGETHVAHDRPAAPGAVAVNLALRRAYAPRARHIFDKVLHDRLDAAAPEAFYEARAIFMLRAPGPTVRSIARLAQSTDMAEYRDPEAAALYYAGRVEHLCTAWDRFAPGHRHGLTAEALLADPDRHVAAIGRWLNLEPPLTNSYRAHRATQVGGGGDPTRSAGETRIEPSPPRDEPPLSDLPQALIARCEAAHAALLSRFEAG